MLFLSLISATSVTALAAEAVSYVDFDEDGNQEEEPGFCTEYTLVEDADVTISGGVTIRETVNLILCDGASLTLHWRGGKFDLLTEGEKYSVLLVKNCTPDISYTYDEGDAYPNRLSATLF